MNKAEAYYIENMTRVIEYQKFGQVLFRPAGLNETVLTMVSGRLETIKRAELGDIIVRNFELGSSSEQYIIGALEKFKSRYELTDQTLYVDSLNWGIAKATGLLHAVEYKGDPFTFKAPWGEDMECLDGDFIGKLPGETVDQVYRIDREAFEKTYRPV